jgi:predicted protein tyrosine phosphatase
MSKRALETDERISNKRICLRTIIADVSVTIASAVDVLQYAKRGERFDLVISITNPRRKSVQHDKHMASIRRAARELSVNTYCFQFYDHTQRTTVRNHRAVSAAVKSIIALARELPKNARVLVHCIYGRFRSTATAAAIIVLRTRCRLSFEEAHKLIMEARPDATPYEEMLDFARAFSSP